MGVGFFGKLFSKGKVSPTITSVKPSVTVRKKGVKASLDKTRSDEYRKRYTALDKAEGKVKTGKKMMQEGQKERKKMLLKFGDQVCLVEKYQKYLHCTLA